MYFQQIFWCLYNKGSDLAGDIRFKKEKSYAGQSIGICNFPTEMKARREKEGMGLTEEKQKKDTRADGRSQKGNGVALSRLERLEVCLLFLLELCRKLWIGIRKKTQPSAWLSCKQCFREQTIHTLTLFLFLFFFVSRRCHMSSHTEHSDQHEQTPKKGTSAKSSKPRIRSATVRL